MPRRELPEVNAGSMADIAFTLLIFFLVSTTLATDKGEKVLLPKWNPDNQQEQDIEITDRNVLAIDVRQDGSLALEGNDFLYAQLKDETIEFLMNNGRNPEYSDSYDESAVNIRVHPDAPYDSYLEAYSNVKKAFTQIRDEYSLNKYGKRYDDFTEAEQEASDEVRDTYPLKLFEKVMDEEDMGGN